jgi:hypothetical protein
VRPGGGLTLEPTPGFSIVRMSNHFLRLLTLAALALVSTRVLAAQHPQMPAGTTHQEHLAQMKKDAELRARGTAAIGFDQDAAAHHFVLLADGGAIEVQATSGNDAATRDAVRGHLREIARDFARGVFEKPFATHAETPSGVADLTRLKDAITYAYESAPRGARVRIRSADADAVAAIHAFLRYQIAEHRTGDPLTPPKR